MPGPLGIIGNLVFVAGLGTTFTIHELTKKRSNSFAKHAIINGIDLIEDTGLRPIEISLQFRFYRPYTQDPSVSLILLEAMADSKVPSPLIIGGCPISRQLFSLWVIEEISSKMPKFSGNILTVLDCDVKLIEYSNAFNLSGPLGLLAQAGASLVGNII